MYSSTKSSRLSRVLSGNPGNKAGSDLSGFMICCCLAAEHCHDGSPVVLPCSHSLTASSPTHLHHLHTPPSSTHVVVFSTFAATDTGFFLLDLFFIRALDLLIAVVGPYEIRFYLFFNN